MSSETSTDAGFNVGHFFVLLSLFAATVAVVMVRPAAPEHLILISLTIGAAGGAAVCFYRVLAPLMAPHADMEQQPMSERLRADLEREKALTLRSIKELEFDRAMGKLSPQDFDQMAGRLRARAMGIMKQLDAGSSAYRTVIEKELAARLGGKQTRSATREQQAARTDRAPVCACGVPNDRDARFCKACGVKLVQA
ncbi:MAG TPA: zinc ribbon domain-containing protein [Vicinamibacterales bacterium]|nr:zinc ribbon domain-containing protein [Vicinamibacterales bacterium]